MNGSTAVFTARFVRRDKLVGKQPVKDTEVSLLSGYVAGVVPSVGRRKLEVCV